MFYSQISESIFGHYADVLIFRHDIIHIRSQGLRECAMNYTSLIKNISDSLTFPRQRLQEKSNRLHSLMSMERNMTDAFLPSTEVDVKKDLPTRI